MVVLSYAWILALIPLLVDKDSDVQWHAKHGIVLSLGEIALYIAFGILSAMPMLSILGCGCTLVPLVTLVIRIIAIVKGLNGEQFRLPFISDFADQWK